MRESYPWNDVQRQADVPPKTCARVAQSMRRNVKRYGATSKYLLTVFPKGGRNRFFFGNCLFLIICLVVMMFPYMVALALWAIVTAFYGAVLALQTVLFLLALPFAPFER